MTGKSRLGKGWRIGLMFVAGLLGGLAFGALVSRFDGGALGGAIRRLVGPLSAWDLPGAIVVYYASVLVHELGHLAGGLIGRGRLLMMTVGPVRVVRGHHRWHVEPFLRAGGFAGLTVMLPDLSRPMRPQLLPLIAGGPLASLLLVVAGVAVAVWTDGRVAAYGALFALVSGFLCACTMIPMRMQGFMNDAAQFIETLRGGSGIAFRQALLALAGESITGVRPRDLDPAMIERAFALDDRGNPLATLGLRQIAAVAALDRGDAVAAAPHFAAIEAGIDDAPQGMRQLFAIVLARKHALLDRDAVAARRWFDAAQGGLVERADRLATEAAVATIEGRADDAARALSAATAALPRHYDPGAARFLADEIERIRAWAPVDTGARRDDHGEGLPA